jgi:hypothetical protein
MSLHDSFFYKLIFDSLTNLPRSHWEKNCESTSNKPTSFIYLLIKYHNNYNQFWREKITYKYESIVIN